MCARMTLTIETIDEIADMLDAEVAPDDARRHKRRYNVAPSDRHWILEYGADRRVLAQAQWGYLPTSPPGRARKPLINVRGEQVASGHGFRAAFWYHRADGGLILLAGLYQPVLAGEDDPRFTVLTTRPNKLISVIHDRM